MQYGRPVRRRRLIPFDALDKTILYAPAPDEMIPRGLPTVDLL